MTTALDELLEQYGYALGSYLEIAGEAGRAEAYELGRRGVAAGLGVVEMAAVHQRALATVLLRALTPEECMQITTVAWEFFKEALAAFDMTYRGFQETHATLRLVNETLKRQAAQLEMAVTELEAFSYSVSHDLRSPLRAMDGFSRILLEEHAPRLPPEAQRYLHLVRDNAQQMDHLIDDLLAFSRLSRQPLSKQLVAPAELARRALADLHAEYEGRQIELSIADLPPCQADPMLLKQALTNLLSNALKFTRQRDVAAIAVGCREEGGAGVYFVKDNGVGFDMRYADKLFGVFQRLHRAEEYEGTGVGLAIVQRIVQRHGGRVWAEAEVDKGATFYFTI